MECNNFQFKCVKFAIVMMNLAVSYVVATSIIADINNSVSCQLTDK